MNFHVGQKVVCVDCAPYNNVPKELILDEISDLVVGKIYKIRAIDFRAAHFHGCPTIRIEENTFPQVLTIIGWWESGYGPWRFRPLVTRKTSIEIFEKLLKLTPQKVSV